MKIWVDADACPSAVRDVVLAAAKKRNVQTIFVANKQLLLPPLPMISSVLVDTQMDAADKYIALYATSQDLVITQDIPLAHSLVTAGVTVINPRGDRYTADNIGERLSTRNLMKDLRDFGEITGGPKQFSDRDKRLFASSFDRELTRLLRISP